MLKVECLFSRTLHQGRVARRRPKRAARGSADVHICAGRTVGDRLPGSCVASCAVSVLCCQLCCPLCYHLSAHYVASLPAAVPAVLCCQLCCQLRSHLCGSNITSHLTHHLCRHLLSCPASYDVASTLCLTLDDGSDHLHILAGLSNPEPWFLSWMTTYEVARNICSALFQHVVDVDACHVNPHM